MASPSRFINQEPNTNRRGQGSGCARYKAPIADGGFITSVDDLPWGEGSEIGLPDFAKEGLAENNTLWDLAAVEKLLDLYKGWIKADRIICEMWLSIDVKRL